MPLFDRYIAVDWSASNKRVSGSNSIWIAELSRGSLRTSNPETRELATKHLLDRLTDALNSKDRVFVGFDFPFGYPAGGGQLLSGRPGWEALWEWLEQHIVDSHSNQSNRFELCASVNLRLDPDRPMFWGHHQKHSFVGLSRYKPAGGYTTVPEKRLAEVRARSAQPVWKLYGNGSVGSQALLGIAALQRLRSDELLSGKVAVWPFETIFAEDLSAEVLFVEIYPSLVKVSPHPQKPKDQLQVESMVGLFAALDERGELQRSLAQPRFLNAIERDQVILEEGWIFGLPA